MRIPCARSVSPLFPHIACCIDDSAASDRALAEARRLRALGPGRLSLVHVAPWPLGLHGGAGGWVPEVAELEKGAREWLAVRAAEVPEAEQVILCGHPAATVCDWAEREHPDLIVVATHRGTLARALLGSFASFLAQHSPCPVLLVRPPATHEEGR